MGRVFVVVRPVPGENLVGLAAEQEIEFLLEDTIDLFAERLIEIGHRPAAELEFLGRIFGRPARCLHDAIDRNLGADDNFSHGSLSLFGSRTNRPLPVRQVLVNVLASGVVQPKAAHVTAFRPHRRRVGTEASASHLPTSHTASRHDQRDAVLQRTGPSRTMTRSNRLTSTMATFSAHTASPPPPSRTPAGL